MGWGNFYGDVKTKKTKQNKTKHTHKKIKELPITLPEVRPVG